MQAALRVDFHCHSNRSDGELSPETLADALAATQAQYAALTDHNTIAGLSAFQTACEARGIETITGLEICASLRGQYLHLLAYGFDPGNPALDLALRAQNNSRSIRAQAVIDRIHSFFLRKRGNKSHPGAPRKDVKHASRSHVPFRELYAHIHPDDFAPARHLQASLAIDLTHRAGGRIFLAHPVPSFNRPEFLRQVVHELTLIGLDGLETGCARESGSDYTFLTDLADEFGLLICAGSDFHGSAHGNVPSPGVLMESERYAAFRQAIINAPGQAAP